MTPTDWSAAGLPVLALVWAAYFVLHSTLASLTAKEWVDRHWPALTPRYRLLYNGLAVMLLPIPLYLMYRANGPGLWAWTGWAGRLADGLALLAVFGFLYSTRWYDMGEFLGLRQWRQREHAIKDPMRLRISPLHRFVRHPWYSLGLVILWTRDMDPALLVSVVAVTVYLVVGARLEERKLLAFHGQSYARYRQRVPGLVPLPGRHLSRKQARALEAEAILERTRDDEGTAGG
ncbi:MAG TPA: hypothetical protein VKA64_09940 [Gammaproteobacteria bacterium]|nr:hypothetical protein [Gammaproteobacteria bacterium]